MQNDHRQPPITFGFDPDLAAGRFVQARSDFLCCPTFSALDKVLYLVLCYHASLGTRSWPSYSRLAKESNASEQAVRASLRTLISASLVTVEQAVGSPATVYYIHSLPASLPRLMEGSGGAIGQRQMRSEERTHIPDDQNNNHNKEQITQDVRLLVDKIGISEAVAESLAMLVAERGCFVGYVAQVVEYATTTPGIKNPAGCVVELIKRNERRRPSRQEHPEKRTDELDLDKYITGKYAFLFAREGNSGGAESIDNGMDRTTTDIAPERIQNGPRGDHYQRKGGQHSADTESEGREL